GWPAGRAGHRARDRGGAGRRVRQGSGRLAFDGRHCGGAACSGEAVRLAKGSEAIENQSTLTPLPFYPSTRNALAGSIRVLDRAGMNVASVAMRSSNAATTASVTPSVGLTS